MAERPDPPCVPPGSVPDGSGVLTSTLTLMGTGTSVGVPMVGCDCPVCRSSDPRNRRTRSGVLLRLADGSTRRHVVIDTAPELRLQLLRENVPHVDAALFTHAHADHIMGLDDLRICSLRAKDSLPLYAEENVAESLRRTFPYAFAAPPAGAHSGAVPQYEFRPLSLDPIDLFGTAIRPLRLWHGTLAVLGFRIGSVAFCTDCSRVDESAWDALAGSETLILDALRDESHPTHFNVEQALEVIDRVAPKQAYLTHISHDLDHGELLRRLPDGVRPAYDGLTVPLGNEPDSEDRSPLPVSETVRTWIEAAAAAYRTGQRTAATRLHVLAIDAAAAATEIDLADGLLAILRRTQPRHLASKLTTAAQIAADRQVTELLRAVRREVSLEEAEGWVDSIAAFDRLFNDQACLGDWQRQFRTLAKSAGDDDAPHLR